MNMGSADLHKKVRRYNDDVFGKICLTIMLVYKVYNSRTLSTHTKHYCKNVSLFICNGS